MANLYLTIKLQGLGWKNGPTEKDYKKLCEAITEVVAKDKQFVEFGKTVSVQIRGYDPIVKGVLLREDGVIGLPFWDWDSKL